ncbi:MAG TPA: hypothetical protein PLO48_14460 [Saprospiraceae bacterium]|nr:hypothetical protein [Saprospiraceae bacterium]
MYNYIFLFILFLVCNGKADVFSQADISKSSHSVGVKSSKTKYYGEGLFWDGPKKIFSVSHLKDGKITNVDFFDINGKKVGSCSYIDNYPYSGTILDHDFIWTVITKKTYVKGFVVGTIIDYDVAFKELNKYAANNSPTMNAENYKNAYTKDGSPYNGKFVIEYSLIEYKDGLMHGFKKNFDFLTRDTSEIISYKNGKKDGLYQYLAIKDSVLAQGFYRDDQPFSGSFLDMNQFIFKTFSIYEEGVLVGINTYHFEYSSTKTNKITAHKLINTCSFRDNKAMNGTFYDKAKYKFFSYENGELTKIYRVNDIKFDTTEILSFFEGKLHGYFKSYIQSWTDKYVVGYYKNGEPFEGEFKDGKDGNIIHKYENGLHTATLDYNSVAIPNYYTKKNGKKEGISIQRVGHSNDTTRYFSTYLNDLPFEGQICTKDEILTYKNGKLDGQCILLDGSRENPKRIRHFVDGEIIKVVNYKVFDTIDSITTQYIDGVIIDGKDIQYDDNTTKLYNYKNGKITGDSTRFQFEENYMIYKGGKKFEGIEYTKFSQYEDTVKLDLVARYQDFKVVNLKGGAHKEWAHFEMNCDDLKCTLTDYSPFKYKTEIVYTSKTSAKVTTYQNQNIICNGYLKNNYLDKGSFAFVNYAGRFDKNLENWTSIIIDINKSSAKITVFRDNQRYVEKFTIKKKLNIYFPVFELYKVLNLRYDAEYIIEYIDKDSDKIIASCKFERGIPIHGITLEQYESIITIKRFKDGYESKVEEVHSADLINTLSSF